MITIDDFLVSYDTLRTFANTCTFVEEKNPSDGVVYPNICKDIPQGIRNDIAAKLAAISGGMVNINAMFLRYSPQSVSVPHIAHHDLVMGKYSLMLYLNDNPEAGTTFLRHRQTGICYAPEDAAYVDIVRQDQNNVDAWVRTSSVAMKSNRGLIFDAGYFHCAEPVGGFGVDQSNGRIVLTTFFS